MKTDARNIPIKTYLNVDEFLDFQRTCKALGMAMSQASRAAVRQFNGANVIRPVIREERPKAGPKRAFSLPGMRGRSGAPMPRKLF